LVRYII